MLRSPHTMRFAKALTIAAALTAALVPAAQAADKSDAVDRSLHSNPAPLAQAGVGTSSKQYGIPRAMPSHYAAQQVGVPRTMPSDYAKADLGAVTKQYGTPRAMPSHYADAGVTLGQQVGLPRANSSTGTAVDFWSPDTREAALGRYPDSGPVLVSVPRGFDWGDATFGVGAAALALLLAGGIAIAVRHRKRVVLP